MYNNNNVFPWRGYLCDKSENEQQHCWPEGIISHNDSSFSVFLPLIVLSSPLTCRHWYKASIDMSWGYPILWSHIVEPHMANISTYFSQQWGSYCCQYFEETMHSANFKELQENNKNDKNQCTKDKINMDQTQCLRIKYAILQN